MLVGLSVIVGDIVWQFLVRDNLGQFCPAVERCRANHASRVPRCVWLLGCISDLPVVLWGLMFLIMFTLLFCISYWLEDIW